MEDQYPAWAQALYWIVVLISTVSMWKLYLKANQPGWASIVPIYNTIIFLKIANKPIWWFILLLVPIVNIVIAFMVTYDFVKAYGKGLGYFLGFMFLPFIFAPLLAFGDSKYLGVKQQVGEPVNPSNQPPTPPVPPTQQPPAV